MSPVRVLHVVGRMDRGGVETWLMHVLRAVDPACARLEFLASTDAPGHYDEEIERLGSKVIPCEGPSRPDRYGRRFLRVLRERGPYDVVHCHLHHFGGFVLALAAAARVPIRIAHAHLDTRALDEAAAAPRRAYLRLMRAALRASATRGIAVSELAGTALFGEGWRRDPRYGIERCGLDFSPFRGPSDGAAVRAELGVPPDALLLVLTGRLDPAKNHALLLRIARAARALEPRTFLLLLGDGPLRAELEAEVVRLGLAGRVKLAGVRPDVPRILRAADVFVMPSLREGLPLAAVEAQAAGLPVVLSDTITREVEVVPELVVWRSIADPPEVWAEAVLAAARSRGRVPDALARLEGSPFSLHRALPALLDAWGATPARVLESA